MMKVLIIVGVLFCLLNCYSCTIAPKDKSSKKEKKSAAKAAASKSQQQSANLSSNETNDKITPEQLTIQELLAQNVESVLNKERVFAPTVMTYVTPWNNKGYDYAKQFANKFDILAPVWFQIKRLNGKVEFTGLHDADLGWLSEVRSANPAIKVTPRILFDGWTKEDLNTLFTSEMTQSAVVQKITQFVKSQPFEGIVCEILLQVGFEYKNQAIHFLSHLGGVFHSNNLMLIVPLPPSLQVDGNPNGFFTPDDYQTLKSSVDYFNVMTYDFTNGKTPGPVSHVTWLAGCILYYTKELKPEERHKFLMGLNFYGYKYHPSLERGEPIVGNQFLDRAKQQFTNTQVTWHQKFGEHEFKFVKTNEVVYYPTLHSIKLRLQLAEKLNIGVAIWELGQGLDYFLNLF